MEYIIFIRRIITIVIILLLVVNDVARPVAYAAQLQNGNLIEPHISEGNAGMDAKENDAALKIIPKQKSGLAVLGLTDTTPTLISARKPLPMTVHKLEKETYNADEDVTLTINNPDNEEFTTKLVDAEGEEVPAVVYQFEQGTQTELHITASNQFKPGKYTIEVTDREGNTTKQDFTWGVLAINTDKAVYQPQETAQIAMAVLDENGEMVCDASVRLTIKDERLKIDDELSTEEGTIVVNDVCKSKEFTLIPDYEATYQVGEAGEYAVQLTAETKNGTYSITDSFTVAEKTPFAIKRTSATRIYPPHLYPMELEITADEDFTGTITETVPESFTIVPADQEESYDKMQLLYTQTRNNPEAKLAQDILGATDTKLQMPFDGDFTISQGFGTALTDISLREFYSQYGLGGHDGIDFALPSGTPLYAVDEGAVIWSGEGDYGITIIIQHTWGRSYYGHLSKTAIERGFNVSKGELIGYSGNTGESTGPHLHFGIKPNVHDLMNGYAGKVDPLPLLGIANTADTLELSFAEAVLAASTSAETEDRISTDSGQITTEGTPLPQEERETEEKISSSLKGEGQVIHSEVAQTRGDKGEDATNSAEVVFAIEDEVINEKIVDDQPPILEKVKVIKWNVSLKKGETVTLSYKYRAPQISPQFYMVGPLKFFAGTSEALIYEEPRTWQIAADAIGTDWYDYSWTYRKQVTIDHTKLGTVEVTPVYDQAASGGFCTLCSSRSWSHTIANQSNRIVLVGFHTANNTATVTYNGVSMTKITSILYGSYYQHLFYLVNPPVGTSTVQISGGSTLIAGGSASFYNVNQSTPLGTAATNSGTSTTPSVSVSSTTSQVVVDTVGTGQSTPVHTAGAGQTMTWDVANLNAGSYEAGASGSTTMSWTLDSSATWGIIGVPLNGTTSPVTQTDFPVLINLTSDTSLSANAQGDADDILFTDETGKTKLSHEIESYTSGTGALVAWVKIPTLSGSEDTDIYMYYGNPSISNQEDATNAWDSNFRSVWHLAETGNGTVGEYIDSTSIGNHGRGGNGTSTNVPTRVTGKIGNAQDFDGSNDLISTTNTTLFNVTSAYTLEAWINADTCGGSGGGTILEKDNVLNYYVCQSTRNTAVLYYSAADTIFEGNSSTITFDTWHHAVAVYNGSGTGTIYIDGVNVTNDSSIVSPSNSNTAVIIGAEATSSTSEEFDGTIDELRISNTNRSASWIGTSYNNQNSPSTFYALGSEETKIYAPTNDRLMRHGNFFNSSGEEQVFVF